MGGGQANKQQATAANAGATGSAQTAGTLANTALQQGNALTPQANQYGAERQQLYNTLWGAPSSSGTGTPSADAQGGAPSTGALTKFLDPNSLNVTAPTGPYAQMYTKANEQAATDTQNALQQVRQDAANRGFTQGSGAQSDAELKAQLAGAAQKGQNFGQATTASYQDALSNFWNAVGANQQGQAGAQQGQLATEQTQQGATGQAIGANQGAAQTYSQLYGTAGAYHPSPVLGAVQSGISAGGAVGSAAMCVCEGTSIWMDDDKYKRIEEIKPRDRIRSRDGHHDEVLDVEIQQDVPCYLLATSGRQILTASGTHTIERPGGGYILVKDCMGAAISTRDGAKTVTELSGIGKRTVYRLKLKHAHIFLSSGVWSLE